MDFRADEFLGAGRWSTLRRADAPLALRLEYGCPQGVDPAVRMQTALLQTRPAALVPLLVASETVRLPHAVLDRAEGSTPVARAVADGAGVRTKFLTRLVGGVTVLTQFQFLRHFYDLNRRR